MLEAVITPLLMVLGLGTGVAGGTLLVQHVNAVHPTRGDEDELAKRAAQRAVEEVIQRLR